MTRATHAVLPAIAAAALAGLVAACGQSAPVAQTETETAPASAETTPADPAPAAIEADLAAERAARAADITARLDQHLDTLRASIAPEGRYEVQTVALASNQINRLIDEMKAFAGDDDAELTARFDALDHEFGSHAALIVRMPDVSNAVLVTAHYLNDYAGALEQAWAEAAAQ